MIETIDDIPKLAEDIAADLPLMSFTDAFEHIEEDLKRQHDRMFADQKDSTGRKWKALKPATIKRKGHDVILFEKGGLAESLANETSDSIREIDRQSMEFGTSDEKAIFHQEGTRHMPARPPVGISNATMNKAAEHVADRALEIVLDSIDRALA